MTSPPLRDVIFDELHMKNRSGKISLERQGADAEYHVDIKEPYRNVNVQWFPCGRHERILLMVRPALQSKLHSFIDETCEERGCDDGLSPIRIERRGWLGGNSLIE